MEQLTNEYIIKNYNDFIFNPPNLVIDFGNAKLCFDKKQITPDELLHIYIKLQNYLNSIEVFNL